MNNSQTCLHRSIIAQSIVYEASTNVVYMNNAKAGCSTIKRTILQRAPQMQILEEGGKLHPKIVHGNTPYWCRDYSRILDKDTFSFSVVRNPFARVLSAFLDKLENVNLLKNQFFWQHGLPPQKAITFLDFLRLLKDSDSLFDQHWRPQVANLYAGFMPLNEVHFLEGFDRTQNSICDRLGGISSFVKSNPHATNARNKVAEYINDEAQALIIDLYQEDFDVFGYSTDLADVADAPEGVLSLPIETPILTDMLAHMHEVHTAFDGFRQSLHALGIADLNDNVAPWHKDIWQDKVIKATSSVVPADRYLALSVVSSIGKQHLDPDFMAKCLFDIVQMAPYQIGNHANLVRHLASVGRREEAQRVLDTLTGMTWQKDMVATLKNALLAASA